MLEVGRILKPQGIRGEVKADPFFDSPEAFLTLERVFLDGTPRVIERARTEGRFVIIKLSGVPDRNEAEKLRGKTLYCKQEEMPPLPEGRWYVAALIGLKVEGKGGRAYGKLTDVLQNGAADVFVVEGERNFSFPAIEGVLLRCDLQAGVIEVDERGLDEVAVYED